MPDSPEPSVDLSTLVTEADYPNLYAYTSPLMYPDRPVLGREAEVGQVLSAMSRPEMRNAVLIAEAGSGKSTIVAAVALADKGRLYREVNVSRMAKNDPTGNELARRIEELFNEAVRFVTETNVELVMFMDEFHQLIIKSPSAVEAIKPVLAMSGVRGVRILAATTDREFRQYIAPNQPLVERLQRLNISAPNRETTIAILKSFAARYGVKDQFADDSMFYLIYDLCERFIPSESQPRKSINILDDMIGRHIYEKRPIDNVLLAEVFRKSKNINISFKIDVSKMSEMLRRNVFGQDMAIKIIEERMAICSADLHDKNKPMSTMLFAGSTGVGKAVSNDTLVPVHDPEGDVRWKRHGDLVPGDYVYIPRGVPTRVMATFPQPLQQMYRVHTVDGRFADVSGEHLWAVCPNISRQRSKIPQMLTMTTEEILAAGIKDGRANRFSLPVSEGVDWPEQALDLDPYLVGVFARRGATGAAGQVTLGTISDDLVQALHEPVSDLLGRPVWYRDRAFVDLTGQMVMADEMPLLLATYCSVRRGAVVIPQEYLTGSREQRWALLQGLVDARARLEYRSNRPILNIASFSADLVDAVRMTCLSLGVTCTTKTQRTATSGVVHHSARIVCDDVETARRFTRSTQMLDTLGTAPFPARSTAGYVAICDIEEIEPQRPMCIYVEDEDHLYQVGDFLVTHNTELSKQMAAFLFPDDNRSFIEFDMSDYPASDNTSARRFKTDLTNAVWMNPFSVILLDEIEKAHTDVTRMLYQVTDEGRLRDDNNNEVTFKNAYIIMTTNSGEEIFEEIGKRAKDDAVVLSDGTMDTERAALKYKPLIYRHISSDDSFPSALLGRMNAIVPFRAMESKDIFSIIDKRLYRLRNEIFMKHGVKVLFDPAVLTYIVEDKKTNVASEGGVRAAIRTMNEELVSALARFILEYPNEKEIMVSIEGQMRYGNKSINESEGRVVVRSNRVTRTAISVTR